MSGFVVREKRINVNGFKFFSLFVIPLAAYDFHFFFPFAKNANENTKKLTTILRPSGARRPLLSFSHGHFRTCLFYLLPGPQNKGQVFSQSHPLLSASQDCVWDPGKKETSLLKDISSLRLGYSLSKKALRPLYEKGLLLHEEFWPMLNFSPKKSWEIYSSPAPARAISGVFFPGETPTNKRGPPLLKSGALCHDFNEQCEEVIPFRCDLCRDGWFEVIGPSCPLGRKRFCGEDICGRKGKTACPRGFRYQVAKKKKWPCKAPPTAVFCEDGLEVTCNAKQKIYTCN